MLVFPVIFTCVFELLYYMLCYIFEKYDQIDPDKCTLCIFAGCGTLLVLDETETGVNLVRR